ncbi:MAG TPA: hypothetical protein VJQ56_07030 [Blastocatellia bacterium]|nr:hypothetical protein [Blastocatellia bacterium]
MQSPRNNKLKAIRTLIFCLSMLSPGAIWARGASAPSEPEARNKAAIVYDAERERVVMFGGATGLGPSRAVTGDTWEWDGRAWSKVSDAGPQPRAAHAMAYDSHRKKIVMFGGEGPGGVLGDTWEWNGRNWTQVARSGPPARAGHRLEYDRLRKRAVLFGGTSRFGRDANPAFNDTWEWDGRAWSRVSNAGPRGRILFGMSYDSRRGRVILFGGNTAHRPPYEAGLMNDTWEWDGRNWTEIDAPGPPGRDHNVMIYDATRGKTVLYGGGANGRLLGDTWYFDGRAWEPVDANSPTRLGADAIAYDNKRKKIVTYGGWEKGPLADIWEFDGKQWVRVK